MKNIKSILLSSVIGLSLLSTTSCTKDLEEINANPNFPEIVPTNSIFNGANRYLFNYTRDGWWMMRMSMPWMQYAAQNNYVEEDKYQYRDVQTSNGWVYLYRTANNYKDIIEKCEDPELSVEMSAYGNLNNQIAASRIMLAYVFDNLVTHFGNVPYWSYGQRENPNFQALKVDEFVTPVYASEEEIYADLLKELKEASEQIVETEAVFNTGDNIYGGDAMKWKKLANSLRLRIANRIKHVYPAAAAEIQDAISSGVFTSNADNAIHAFGTTNNDANPFWKLFYVGNRTDFWVNRSFIQLLKGEAGEFGFDPRLYKVAAPKGITFNAYTSNGYTNSDDMDDYPGMPYGLPDVEPYYQVTANINIFSKEFLKIDRGEVLIEYSEVEFLLSEVNGWDQDHYENGVRANMERLGIADADIANFISGLPVANEESVLTQKYVTLMYNPDESWNEYRRTGYPTTDILLMPGEASKRPHDGSAYTFTPLQSGNVIATDIPSRVRYPVTQQTLNPVNWSGAAQALGGDEIDKKLWFAK
ncbi:SusD/RagB family nutrient-binding outer membrane lipoprotein [Sphingobacterium shayense]|uniref:SusD/RagB family nutrient-binding outer membrane lipoprotein n=1 Tax=Sphingobacterium shayense TaxID=626343 RepID=UPI0015571F1F|nr:SusD/RagB family nutrient-binding outer membrane lipoprotein [Sphingobacterium shayense]NQD70464.1 SusD/RagB family nutrient-binding outer membrane lipoprotein [Sphingobacterium shayense]